MKRCIRVLCGSWTCRGGVTYLSRWVQYQREGTRARTDWGRNDRRNPNQVKRRPTVRHLRAAACDPPSPPTTPPYQRSRIFFLYPVRYVPGFLIRAVNWRAFDGQKPIAIASSSAAIVSCTPRSPPSPHAASASPPPTSVPWQSPTCLHRYIEPAILRLYTCMCAVHFRSPTANSTCTGTVGGRRRCALLLARWHGAAHVDCYIPHASHRRNRPTPPKNTSHHCSRLRQTCVTTLPSVHPSAAPLTGRSPCRREHVTANTLRATCRTSHLPRPLHLLYDASYSPRSRRPRGLLHLHHHRATRSRATWLKTEGAQKSALKFALRPHCSGMIPRR